MQILFLLWLLVAETLAFNCDDWCNGEGYKEGGVVKGSGPTCTGDCGDCSGKRCAESQSMDSVSGCWTGKYQCCCQGKTDEQIATEAAVKAAQVQIAIEAAAKKAEVEKAAAAAAAEVARAAAAAAAKVEKAKAAALAKAAADKIDAEVKAKKLQEKAKRDHEKKIQAAQMAHREKLSNLALKKEQAIVAEKKAERAALHKLTMAEAKNKKERALKLIEVEEARRARLHDLNQRKIEMQLSFLNQTKEERVSLRKEMMVAVRKAGEMVRKRYDRSLLRLQTKMDDAVADDFEEYERLEKVYERIEVRMEKKIEAAQRRVSARYTKQMEALVMAGQTVGQSQPKDIKQMAAPLKADEMPGKKTQLKDTKQMAAPLKADEMPGKKTQLNGTGLK